MDLDWRVCSRARLSRDPRFDGKFFIAVISTGVYCRPICRARTAQEKNVRYFPTAAAAQEAGFRPCLLCRPECSPGTPAWAGTQSTVSRALRIIAQSGLESGGVEALAERLGIGSRHLRRLFLRHVGATPSAVAATRRLHFAKKLLDETRLPMHQLAIASGFGCVRRFNAAIRKAYQRTPTQIRSRARHQTLPVQNQYSFCLDFRPPYDWKSMLGFLAARATPGVEAVESGSYRRSICLNDSQGYFEVTLGNRSNALAIRVQIGDPCLLFPIVERIRAMFDVNADWSIVQRTLGADPVLGPRLQARPGLRVPGCWDGFELAVRAILGQQVSVKQATNLAGRMVAAFGQPFVSLKELTHLFPSPEILANADLRSLGVIDTRAKAIRALARAISDGQINFAKIADNDAFLTQLCAIPGIGQWTAQYVAMRALREPDALPYGDIGLLRPLQLRNASELERRSQPWRPWRAYAAMYLWHMHGESKTRPSEKDTDESRIIEPAARRTAPPRLGMVG